MHNIFFTDGGCIFHNIIILRNAVLRLFFYDRILRILIDDLNFAEYSISFVDAVNTLQRNHFSNLIRCGGILCTKDISIIKSGHVDVIFDRIIIFIIDLLIDRGVYKFCHRLSVIIQHDISFFIGLFPQETGNHYGTEWAAVFDAEGRGLLFKGIQEFEFSALHYTAEDLDAAQFAKDLQPRKETIVRIDYKQSGIGSNSCGPKAMEKDLLYFREPVEFVLVWKPYRAMDASLMTALESLGLE